MDLLNEQISKDVLKKYLKELYTYCLEHLKGIDRDPKIIFNNDQANADDLFGKTGYYDPDKEQIHLFITDRHPKDILRSLAHELVHHEQNCRGDNESLDLKLTARDPAYASHDKGLREMERDAFERGNMIFRDWCDMKKMQRTKLMENKTMKVKIKEREMTAGEKEKRHDVMGSLETPSAQKRLKKQYPGQDPMAMAGKIATSQAMKGEEEMDEMSYEKAKEAGLESPEKADLKTNGKKGDGDISKYELKRGMAIQKNMKKEAHGDPEELDFGTLPSSHRKAGMSDFEMDPDADEPHGHGEESSEEEVEVSPFDNAQSLAGQIKAALSDGDKEEARQLTRELLKLLQKNPDIKLHHGGKEVDVSKVKMREGDTYGEAEAVGSEGKKVKCESCGSMYEEGKKHSCEEGKKAMNESKEKEGNPYPQLFQEKQRLFKERFNTHEETVYQELMKRFIKKEQK